MPPPEKKNSFTTKKDATNVVSNSLPKQFLNKNVKNPNIKLPRITERVDYKREPNDSEVASFIKREIPTVLPYLKTVGNYSEEKLADVTPDYESLEDREILFKRHRPVAYPSVTSAIGDVAKDYSSRIFKTELQKPFRDSEGDYDASEEAWRMTLGLPVKQKYIVPSKYRPLNETEPNSRYYTLNEKMYDKNKLREKIKELKLQPGQSAYLDSFAPFVNENYMNKDEFSQVDPLQKFKLGVNKQGKSYFYDKYDFDFKPLTKVVKPYEYEFYNEFANGGLMKLNKYNYGSNMFPNGGNTKTYTDLDEYKKAKQAYSDSLDLYNYYNNVKNQFDKAKLIKSNESNNINAIDDYSIIPNYNNTTQYTIPVKLPDGRNSWDLKYIKHGKAPDYKYTPEGFDIYPVSKISYKEFPSSYDEMTGGLERRRETQYIDNKLVNDTGWRVTNDTRKIKSTKNKNREFIIPVYKKPVVEPIYHLKPLVQNKPKSQTQVQSQPNKPSYQEFLKSVNPDYLGPDYNLEEAYKNLPLDMMKAWAKDPEKNHLPDTYKLPNHPTFSNESIYYKPGMKAGRWEGDNYIPIPATIKPTIVKGTMEQDEKPKVFIDEYTRGYNNPYIPKGRVKYGLGKENEFAYGGNMYFPLGGESSILNQSNIQTGEVQAKDNTLLNKNKKIVDTKPIVPNNKVDKTIKTTDISNPVNFNIPSFQNKPTSSTTPNYNTVNSIVGGAGSLEKSLNAFSKSTPNIQAPVSNDSLPTMDMSTAPPPTVTSDQLGLGPELNANTNLSSTAEGTPSGSKGSGIKAGQVIGAVQGGINSYNAIDRAARLNQGNTTGESKSQQIDANVNAVDTTINSALNLMGPVGQTISAIRGVGDMIGKPIKEAAEARNPDGSLKDPERAKTSAIIGSFFDPIKALTTRASYKGGWTDFTGDKYIEAIEGKKKINYADPDTVNRNLKVTPESNMAKYGGKIYSWGGNTYGNGGKVNSKQEPKMKGGKYWEHRNPKLDSKLENVLEYAPVLGNLFSVNDWMDSVQIAYNKPNYENLKDAGLETLSQVPFGKLFTKLGKTLPLFIDTATNAASDENLHAMGGPVTFSSGGEKHKVYIKESPTGLGKGVEGHVMVNHPTMDKGKWDTIDLTKKAGAKTVAQGVAATKKWHRENPSYAMGGPIKNTYANGGLSMYNFPKGLTHEQHPWGGYPIGGNNYVESEEVVLDKPDGGKYIFSNRLNYR